MTEVTAGCAAIASTKESCTIQLIEACGYAARNETASGTERQTSPRALGRIMSIEAMDADTPTRLRRRR